MKRFIDILLSFIGLLVLSPLIILLLVILAVFQKRPVFFLQERIGKGGVPFQIIKFRSMQTTSESDGKPRLTQQNDIRLTTIGHFLRKHHLDELPQLWNVLKGDMSIVGPRPERKYYIDKIIEKNPRYVELYKIRPGLTSYATLHNGYTDTIEKMLLRLDMDLYYLEHQSLLLDFKIMLETVARMILGERNHRCYSS